MKKFLVICSVFLAVSAYADCASDLVGVGITSEKASELCDRIGNQAVESTGLVINDGAGTSLWRFDTGGDFISLSTTDIGWTVKAGANTACNTTCVNGCVMGWDTSATTANITSCGDAGADECLCAGN